MARVADRGQLLLAAAFGLAIVLVALALVVNSVVYTGTLATTDGVGSDERAATRYHHGAVTGTRGLIATVNDRSHASHATLTRNLSTGVTQWDALAGKQYALEGAATNATLSATTNETRIGQDDPTRALTDRSGAANWTVAASVPAIYRQRYTVSRSSLTAVPPGTDCRATGDCFAVVVDNGTDTWRLFAATSPSGTDIAVEIVDPNGATTTCSVAASTATIDLTNGTLAGTACPALDVTAALDGPYTITHRRGDRARGSYRLVVEGIVPAGTAFDNDDAPYARPGVAAVTVRVRYRTADLTYETDTRVLRGGLDG
ncbi:hypothetical protein ACFQL1_08560 [Halomicroarcula sp. GCM10025709]|uniref:DUF7261 family protein n=1 Tax=Haloarcula TaxID=2237 RepID=UPI0024C31476|nr:hypothetical protein [Halomicroarcula sp. YJ-61-S]